REGMRAMGLSDKVRFIWASDLVDSGEYFTTLIKLAKHTSLSRLRRALPIMGRVEGDAEKDFSMYIYPIMQVTDISVMNIDIALGGMDQRHAHMLQRDIADKSGIKKVSAIHGPLLGSLKGPGRMDAAPDGEIVKMSKSDPDSAIFIFDSEASIRRKLSSAFCPMGEVKGNPVMDVARHIIYPYYQKEFMIHRPVSKGGDFVYNDYDELEAEYIANRVHPMDLKAAVGEVLVEMLGPARSIYEQYEEEMRDLGYTSQ
ncbi:tyrosyl-tRNA synthetase, partial [mine drainage metagenome]